MKAKGFTLSRPVKFLLYSSLGLLLISGIAWLVLHYFFAVQTDYATIPSSYESLALSIHGLAVPVFLIVFGAIFPSHMKRGIKARRNMSSGISMIVVFGLLLTTGYLLYYTGHETLRNISSLLHWLIGLSMTPILFLHIFKGRAAARPLKA